MAPCCSQLRSHLTGVVGPDDSLVPGDPESDVVKRLSYKHEASL